MFLQAHHSFRIHGQDSQAKAEPYLYRDLQPTHLRPKNNIPTKGSNTHVRLVTYPNGDGNLTNMWVS